MQIKNLEVMTHPYWKQDCYMFNRANIEPKDNLECKKIITLTYIAIFVASERWLHYSN